MSGNGWRVRGPAVAGTFYPSDPERLREAVEAHLVVGTLAPAPLRAVVVPHAGYRYSGAVAGEAFARVAAARGTWQRVVVAGPSHFVPVEGIATPSHDAFATPLGSLPLDRGALDELATAPGVVADDRPHAREHSLEVELPFLQRTIGDVALVPLAVGAVRPEIVADVLARVWDEDTLLVVSTDLSHYLPYDLATDRDRRTADAVVARRPDAIGPHDACGAYALRGFLALAQRRDLQVRLVALRNSGDTAGSRDEVVGYGAFVAA